MKKDKTLGNRWHQDTVIVEIQIYYRIERRLTAYKKSTIEL